MTEETSVISPPNSMTVPSDPRIILYHPDGRPLTRTIGFRVPEDATKKKTT